MWRVDNDGMSLRNPVYLDLDSLVAQADYHGVDVPVAADIVERTVRQRAGTAKLAAAGVGAGGSRGSETEFQTSYTMNPSQRASVSKIIDELIRAEVLTEVKAGAVLAKDDLVELEGTARMTTASLAGKLFHILLRYLRETDQRLSDIDLENAPEELEALVERTYIGNELAPIPLLVELEREGLEQKVFVNLKPSFFVDQALVDRIEGDHRVLGTIRNLVAGGNHGFLSSEEWLLDGWEYLVKRMMMIEIADTVREFSEAFNLDLPADDVHAWIRGPSIVVDAIAVY
jgi:hypothetical protein